AGRAGVGGAGPSGGGGVGGGSGASPGAVAPGPGDPRAPGAAANAAARLQQAAEPGEVLLGGATLELVRDAVEVDALEPLELKGKAQPVEAFRLIAAHEPGDRPSDRRFVGRERELSLLGEAWERSLAAERCELFTVVGEPGVGK